MRSTVKKSYQDGIGGKPDLNRTKLKHLKRTN